MKKKPIYILLLFTLPTAVVIVAVFVLMNWYTPTRVQVDLTVDRAIFTVGGINSTSILNSVRLQSLTVEKFTRIDFNPERLEVADPAQYILTEDRYPESAWTSLPVTSQVVITGNDEALQPAVTLESVQPGRHTWGILDRVWARPGSEVTVEVRDAQAIHLTVTVDRQESFAALSIREPFQLITDFSRVSGITGVPDQAASRTYRAQLPDSSPSIEITGQPHSLILVLTILPEKTTDFFPKAGIPVTALDFTRQGEMGNRVTTLMEGGQITYPEYPAIAKASFTASDFIGLDRLEKFRIEEIALDPEHKGMRFRLSGVAGHIRTGSRAFSRDHRLTRFDTLRQNVKLTALFGIVVWVFPTMVGGYRLYKEFKG